MANLGIGGHQSTIGKNDEWLTPPELIKSLGNFDLDPCAPIIRPWDTAQSHYTIEDNGLLLPWNGRVWLNPPYNRYEIGKWLAKMADHQFGISLLFARTDTEIFQQIVFPYAQSMLFLSGRITFYDVKGNKGKFNGGAPSVLISYSEFDSDYMNDSGIKGHHLLVNSIPVITISQSPDWRSVVSISLVKLNGKASLDQIYSMVERVAPDKVNKNRHYKEKIRQKLQKYFYRVDRGVYQTELFQ